MKKFLFPILLVLLEIFIFLTNYKSGTYFVGWDNLFPELNYSANIERSFFGVWQDSRGLGLLDGMSFAANLPHYLFLSFLSLFIPQNILRYLFIFLMHFLGGLGMYFLLKREILFDIFYKKNYFINLISFSGALFYLLNLATIQMFYAPYELFTVHYAFLPWLCLYLVNYLKNGSLISLSIFTLFSILAVPQAHVPTVFLVYCFFIATLLFSSIFRREKFSLKRSVVIISIIFFCNAFWGLPFIYSSINNQKTIINAKINQMSGEDIYLKNKFRGNVGDILFLKGFMLDMIEPKKGQQPDFIMAPWRQHLESPIFIISSAFFAGLFLLGFYFALLKKKNNYFPYVILSFLSFAFLANDTFPFIFLNDYLRDKIPLFRELFRFNFTKFSILWFFTYTIFFSYGLARLTLFFDNKKRKKSRPFHLRKSILILPTFLLLVYAYPVFGGNFLFKELKNNIPSEYFQAIQFLKSQDKNTRIALFPQPSFWSWRFYNWGSRGSGFFWYGINQSTLDRAFDPWSQQNEESYWEISHALYSYNLLLFESLLEKYQIKWLLVDEYIYNPGSYKSLYLEESRELFEASKKIKLAKDFGKIKIYWVDLKTPLQNNVFIGKNLPIIGPSYQWNNLDKAYLESGHYLSSGDNYSLYYPFRSLFTGRKQEELEFTVREEDDRFVFRQQLFEEITNFQLELLEIKKEELVRINPDNLAEISYEQPEVRFDNNQIEVFVPKIKGYLSAEIDPASNPEIQEAKNCNQSNQGQVVNEIVSAFGFKLLRLKATNAQNCTAAFWLPNLPHKYAYLISVESSNIKGKSLTFWLENLMSRKADLEVLLPEKSELTKSYFVQPPMDEYGLGYTLHFDNQAIGRDEVINDLGKITVDLIPYEFLTSLKFIKNTTLPETKLFPIEAKHPNPSLYEINLDNLETVGTTLILSQSFHSGWQAYLMPQKIPSFFALFFGQKIENHILVNNWQNGWQLDSLSKENFTSKKITLVFWPQYLEYFGFLLLIAILTYFSYNFFLKRVF